MNTYSVVNNMYYQGSVRHEDMASLKTRNYIIEIKREDVACEFMDVQYHYRCILEFKDLLGRTERVIVLNEAQANILIDNLGTFVYDNYSELFCLTNIAGPSVLETYGIKVSEVEEGGDFCALFQLICFNGVTNTSYPILSTTFTLEELDNFCDVLFFVFLIDLVSEREGIFKV